MRGWLLVVIAAGVAAGACGDREAAIVRVPMPNAPAPEKVGQVELTKYADKVVATNHTDRAVTDCVVILDETIRGTLGALPPGATVTLMRSRFHPYTEQDAFYRRAKKAAKMECQTLAGPVVVRFGDGPEYTVPAAALIPRK